MGLLFVELNNQLQLFKLRSGLPVSMCSNRFHLSDLVFTFTKNSVDCNYVFVCVRASVCALPTLALNGLFSSAATAAAGDGVKWI